MEKPDGDDTRRFLPPDIRGQSAAYMMMNRNKRGIALDLKQEAGVAVLKRLLEGADVVIENYRMGTMEKLGLGYEALEAVNPDLIYCEISGFGRTGPYADRGGFDLDRPGHERADVDHRRRAGPAAGQSRCAGHPTSRPASWRALGVVAAYARRLQTGEGQKVDTSLFEAGIVHTYWQSAIAFATGSPPGPMGSAHPLNAPYQAFRDRRRLAQRRRRQPEELGTHARRDRRGRELADDPRFAATAIA